MRPIEPWVVLDPAARALRRGIGPVAWVVLEALAASADPDAEGRWACTTNVRRLAAELGLSKDRVARARALRRLAAATALLGPSPAAPSRPIRRPKGAPAQPELFTTTAKPSQ